MIPTDEFDLQNVINPPAFRSPVLAAAVIREKHSDFRVEELPLYAPDGAGDHLFLLVEKTGVASGELLGRFSRSFRVSPGDIGIAGQKDRHGITIQWVSVPRSAEQRVAEFADPEIQILSVIPHRNKLKTGHLQGNRFRLTLRSNGSPWTSDDRDRVAGRLDEIAEGGFPSYFGPQRFGHEGSTLRTGLALLQGKFSPKRWTYSQQRFMKRLVLSAVQSAHFNLVLSDRVQSQTFQVPQNGDVVIRKNGSRPFLFSDSQSSRPDAAGENPVLVPAGPMWGPEFIQAGDDVDQCERDALKKLGLTGDEFQRFAKLCRGTRRPMIQFPEHCAVSLTTGGAIELQFDLRAGTYATVLLKEICGAVIDAAKITRSENPVESGLNDFSDEESV
ncbi:MAG: tRNA pseudouridine(13) synthase TruD [Planctomyces sp.]